MIYLTSVKDFKKDTVNDDIDKYISEIADKNLSALEKLYKITNTSVYSFALSILKNTYDAQDVMHDCYISIFSSAENYHSYGKPLAWILKITKNLCLMKLREYKKKSDIPKEDWEFYLDSHDNISYEDKLVIRDCMNKLSDEERQIVVLHAVSGFKHREIADILEIPLSTVLSKYSRAVKKFKISYEEADKNEKKSV